MVDGLLQVLIVRTEGEVDIVAAVDGCGSLLNGTLEVGELVDGGVVAHHHAIEAYIVAQDVLQDFAVGNTLRAMYGMIARHHHLATRQADHCLVGHEDFLHELLFAGIATTAVAQVVFRARRHTLLQIALLQTSDKRRAHDGRQIAVFAIRLLQSVERRIATHVDHRRQCQHTTHAAQGAARLARLQLSQLRIERAGLSDLLRIDGGADGVDAREHFFVHESRYAVGRVVHEPLLHGCHPVAQVVRVAWLLHAELREVADAIGNELATLRGVQPSVLAEEVVHIHAFQLCDALLLRHPAVKFIHLLFHVCCVVATCQQGSEASHCYQAETSRHFVKVLLHVDMFFAKVHLFFDNATDGCKKYART